MPEVPTPPDISKIGQSVATLPMDILSTEIINLNNVKNVIDKNVSSLGLPTAPPIPQVGVSGLTLPQFPMLPPLTGVVSPEQKAALLAAQQAAITQRARETAAMRIKGEVVRKARTYAEY